MELFTFLVSYSTPLNLRQVPSIEVLEASLAALSPFTRHVQHLGARAARTIGSPWLQAILQETTCDDALELLNAIGVALTRKLLPEYNRIMGMDNVAPYLGSCAIVVNELTWREVARVVLTAACCKHIGMNDTDILSTLRGRGYTNTPDSADRRVLRLIRRRIWYRYGCHLWRMTTRANDLYSGLSNQSQSYQRSLPPCVVREEAADTSTLASKNVVSPGGIQSPPQEYFRKRHMLHLGHDTTAGLVVRITTPSVYARGVHRSVTSIYSQIALVWCELYAYLASLGPSMRSGRGHSYSCQAPRVGSYHVITAAKICLASLQAYIAEADGRHVTDQRHAMTIILRAVDVTSALHPAGRNRKKEWGEGGLNGVYVDQLRDVVMQVLYRLVKTFSATDRATARCVREVVQAHDDREVLSSTGGPNTLAVLHTNGYVSQWTTPHAAWKAGWTSLNTIVGYWRRHRQGPVATPSYDPSSHLAQMALAAANPAAADMEEGAGVEESEGGDSLGGSGDMEVTSEEPHTSSPNTDEALKQLSVCMQR